MDALDAKQLWEPSMSLRITSTVRIALLAIAVLYAATAQAGEEAPDTTWLSPLFELESIDKIDERMNREFFPGGEGIPLVKGEWPGDDETLTNNCVSYEKLYNEGYYARTNYTLKILQFHTAICHALELLASAKPARTSFVSTFKFDRKAVTFLPAMITSAGSNDYACRQFVANERRISWSDFSTYEFEEIEVVNDYEMNTKTIGEHVSLQILARADFNNDGLEDIMVRVHQNAVGGTWGSTGITLITRDSPNGVFWVLKSAIFLDPNYTCEETYDYPDALRDTN